MKKRYVFAGGAALAIYLAVPFAMGAREVGFRRGPVFYPEWLHDALFTAGCEEFNGYKPRQSTVQILYRRALFWGLPERKKSEAECATIRAELKARNSPLLYLIEEAEREAAERSKRKPNKPLHGTPAEAPSSSTESEGRRP